MVIFAFFSDAGDLPVNTAGNLSIYLNPVSVKL